MPTFGDVNKKLENVEIIGNGTFGTVFGDKTLAYKRVSQRGVFYDDGLREVLHSAAIRNDQANGIEGSDACVKILDVLIGAIGYIITMELSPQSLFKMIVSDTWNGNVAPNFDLRRALEYLHTKQNIWHRDVKPGNVLTFPTEDGNYISKLCDFGASRLHGSKFGINDSTKDCQTTYMYACPALLKQDKRPEVGCEADYYALGATILHALNPRRFFLEEESEKCGLAFALNTIPELLESAGSKLESHQMDMLWQWVSMT